MFFPESEAIARDHIDLAGVIEQVDDQLSFVCTPSPLRPSDVASVIGADDNQVASVFALLAKRRIVMAVEMVECARCQNLLPAEAFRQAVRDEDEFECTGCGWKLLPRSETLHVYRMAATALARTKRVAEQCEFERKLEATLGPYENMFKQLGDVWAVRYGGITRFFQDSVGLAYIARLLSDPNRDIPAVSLLAARAGIEPLMASGSCGEFLDDQGRAKYKGKYEELAEELASARANNDPRRIEKILADMDVLGTELARATGLFGRTRTKTDADKVRKSVSMAVARDVERITKKHSSVGLHLDAAISSGKTFRYSPQEEIHWMT